MPISAIEIYDRGAKPLADFDNPASSGSEYGIEEACNPARFAGLANPRF